jgi:hypothetical protein
VEFGECLRELMHIVFTTKKTEDMPHYLPYYTLGFGKGQ